MAYEETEVTESSDQDESENKAPKELLEIMNDSNICETFGEAELAKHLQQVVTGIAADEESMARYLKKYKKAIRRVKLLPEHDKKDFPFDDASNVVLPYLFDAATDFNARATPALLERRDICYIGVYGKDEHVIPPEVLQELEQMAAQGEEGQQQAQQAHAQIMQQLESQPTPKQARGQRVAEAINFDLTCGMPEWREQTDKAMLLLPIAGMYFRKIWQCGIKNRRMSELIWPDKLIFDHESDTFEEAPRKSFTFTKTRNEVHTKIRSGEYKEWEGFDKDRETLVYTFTETHCNLDLDDDGYAEPYIAIIADLSQTFVSIVPRFLEDDIKANKDGEIIEIEGEDFFTQTIFIPDPAGTCIGLGYGIIADDMFSVIDTNTNQMVDAGTLNNIAANTGFIKQGAKVGPRAGNRQKKGTIEMTMGKFTTWESDGTSPLQNDIAQLPFAGPSASLLQLLEMLKGELREMTTASQGIEAQPGEAMGMYLAKLHQALIKPNSIMVRVFNGLTKEFQRIYEIQKRYMSEDEYMDIIDDTKGNKEADYEEGYDIKTTADPSQGSEMERTARAETMLEKAIKMPQVFDLRHAAEEWSTAIGADTEKYVPAPKANEPDPIQLMIAKSQEAMSEAEKMKGMADIVTAKAKMMQANINMSKMDVEIEKMETEILKNLSEVDKNQTGEQMSEQKLTLERIKSQREDLRELINAAQIGATRLAQQPGNQGVPESTGTGGGGEQSGFNGLA
jgi:chaperonin GroES